MMPMLNDAVYLDLLSKIDVPSDAYGDASPIYTPAGTFPFAIYPDTSSSGRAINGESDDRTWTAYTLGKYGIKLGDRIESDEELFEIFEVKEYKTNTQLKLRVAQ